ncbi:Hypothetical predicted protein, partial [Pelobates cultripes]
GHRHSQHTRYLSRNGGIQTPPAHRTAGSTKTALRDRDTQPPDTHTAKDGSLLQPGPGMPQPNSTRMYKAHHRITAAPPAYQRLLPKAGVG